MSLDTYPNPYREDADGPFRSFNRNCNECVGLRAPRPGEHYLVCGFCERPLMVPPPYPRKLYLNPAGPSKHPGEIEPDPPNPYRETLNSLGHRTREEK